MVLEGFPLPLGHNQWRFLQVLEGESSDWVFPVVSSPPVMTTVITESQDQSLTLSFWVPETAGTRYRAWIRNHYNIKCCWLVHVVLYLSIVTFCTPRTSLFGRTLRTTTFFLLFENNQSKQLLGVSSFYLLIYRQWACPVFLTLSYVLSFVAVLLFSGFEESQWESWKLVELRTAVSQLPF